VNVVPQTASQEGRVADEQSLSAGALDTPSNVSVPPAVTPVGGSVGQSPPRDHGCTLELHGFVLHLRGAPTAQPASGRDGSLLLWNGEEFGGLGLRPGENDTAAVLLALDTASAAGTGVASVMARLRGPWAFVYWHAASLRLWFGRDCFGRRSLVWRLPQPGGCHNFWLSSVAVPDSEGGLAEGLVHTAWEEVPAAGLFCVSLDDGRWSVPVLHPWSTGARQPLPSPIITSNTTLLPPADKLDNAAAAAGLPVEDAKITGCDAPAVEDALEAAFAASQLLEVLLRAVRRRVSECVCEGEATDADGRPPVAILFSGGIDSMVLAALVHRALPSDTPVALLNVAFENPRIVRAGAAPYSVPDRDTGLRGMEELQRACPGRPWHFVHVNVPVEELRRERARIRQLIQPLDTVLDDSIGCAIWFAARGRGVCVNGDGAEEAFQADARVLVLGMGADEQLGGYARHRTAFDHRGWPGLLAEVRRDVERISTRNLGRDDRWVLV